MKVNRNVLDFSELPSFVTYGCKKKQDAVVHGIDKTLSPILSHV